jgi:excisionase family DNA binding protein
MSHSAPVERPEHPEPATYTVPQLAALLDVSTRHVHRLQDQKAIPGELRIGKCVRFARKVIDRWLGEGATR